MKVCVVQIQFIFEPNSTLVCIMKKLNASLKSKKTYFTRQHALDTCNNKAGVPGGRSRVVSLHVGNGKSHMAKNVDIATYVNSLCPHKVSILMYNYI